MNTRAIYEWLGPTLIGYFSRAVNIHTPEMLVEAIQSGDLDRVRYLIENGVSVDVTTKDGFTPLILSALLNRLEIAQLLIEKGADPNKPATSGYTPLRAAVCKDYLPLIQLLIKSGADVDSDSYYGETPLLAAVRCSRADEVRILLENGANKQRAYFNGETALFMASTKAKSTTDIDALECAKLLTRSSMLSD